MRVQNRISYWKVFVTQEPHGAKIHSSQFQNLKSLIRPLDTNEQLLAVVTFVSVGSEVEVDL